MPLSVGDKLGPYEILAHIGEGGMGVVYRARDTRLRRIVALKILPFDQAVDAGRQRRLLQEARAVSALNHPNVVVVYDIARDAAVDFLVMEYIHGKTLKEWIADGVLPSSEVSRYGAQIASALASAHAAGIVHRDIKPANVMITAEGQVKVLDFGLAKLASLNAGPDGETLGDQTQTTPGTVFGTVAYLSPEQARGDPLDGKSDMFSLGVLLYELATGEHPFRKPGIVATLQAIVASAPVPPSRLDPSIPAGLENLLLAMLEKEPGSRPSAAEAAAELAGQTVLPPAPIESVSLPFHFVGREREIDELRTAYSQVAAGKGSLVCVSGEPGLGKTTLVEKFLAEVSGALIARGRCSESLADSEAYLPVFEAVSDLLRATGTASAGARILKSVAPRWYLAIAHPSREDSSSMPAVESRIAVSPEGVKREIATFFAELCRIRPLILFLEDIHWADVSTIDLIGYLGRKLQAMGLLLVTTYRQSELLAAKHPFRQVRLELQARNLAREISLLFLDKAALNRYVELEFPGHCFPANLVELIHTKTEGHPLFMADLLRDLRDRGILTRTNGQWILASTVSSVDKDLPASIQGMIERKISMLADEDRRLLAAAAVQGQEFDSSVLAEILEVEPEQVEERLSVLDQVHVLVRIVGEREFPNGTLSIRYRFVHALYQNIFSESLTASRRVRFGLATGRRLEEYYGSTPGAPVSELARLFEQGRDFQRASAYYLSAARNAARVFAHQECVLVALKGIACHGKLTDSPERAASELSLQFLLGNGLMATHGFAGSESLAPFRRARELCRQYGLAGEATALFGLWAFYLVAGNFQSTSELATELLALALSSPDPATHIQAHFAMGFTGLYTGRLQEGATHFEMAIAIPDPAVEPEAIIFQMHHSVLCRGQFGVLLWILGYPDRALELSNEGLARGEKRRSLYDICWSQMNLSRVQEPRGETQAALQSAENSIALGREHGLQEVSVWAQIYHAGCLSQMGRAEEGLAELRTYLDTAASIGSRILRTDGVARLAGCLLALGKYEEGLAAIQDCIRTDVANGERFYEPELYRLAGECHLGCGREVEAEDAFRKAVEIAHRMEARAWELRAASSLGRLLQTNRHWAQSHQILEPVYGWFTEGFETKDLHEAKLLLESAKPNL